MQEPEDNLKFPKIERRILLLCDSWSSVKDGIAGVNRSLALNLTRYKGIKVYTTICGNESSLSDNARKEIKDNNVQLITSTGGDIKQFYISVNDDPLAVFPDLKSHLSNATYIVGHSPITAEAALKLKNSTYPKAKVILFYHMIPTDVDWLATRLPYEVPTDTELVRQAEEADVVYSVTDKCHWYYKAKFRNRAQTVIDHRPFFPQCSEEAFLTSRKAQQSSNPKILVLCDGNSVEDWQGLDIAACAANKIATASVNGSKTRPIPILKIGGVGSSNEDSVMSSLKHVLNHPDLKVEVGDYTQPEALYKDLSECSLCLVPSRSEPFGTVGLFALSAGIPTLISQDSSLATVITRLTSEPEYFTVPVTKSTVAVRQDASMWRDRALGMLQDPETAHERAMQLRTALRRDEPTKESHDNFVSYCLGGINLIHTARSVEALMSADEDKELPMQRDFNDFLTAVMKQCWRLKHHPLTKEDDLFQLLPGIKLPITELLQRVTDKIEEKDRRIVGVCSKTGGFVVYCPTPDALSDLWAMCDVINDRLLKTLLVGDPCPILRHFKVKKADVASTINGPEFLSYKKELMKNLVIE